MCDKTSLLVLVLVVFEEEALPYSFAARYVGIFTASRFTLNSLALPDREAEDPFLSVIYLVARERASPAGGQRSAFTLRRT